MEAFKVQTIGEIAAADYRTSRVFRSFGIDFYCGGDKTIADACSEVNIEPEAVNEALKKLGRKKEKENAYNNWPLNFLVDYIINNHHNKMRKVLPEIKFYARKVAAVHGGGGGETIDMYEDFTFHSSMGQPVRSRHIELIAMSRAFVKLAAKILKHINNQEQKVFPFIKKMAANKISAGNYKKSYSISMVEMVQEEHKKADVLMKKLRSLSNNFTLPKDACSTYGVYYKKLQAFEENMHKHIHLENNILFPKALKLSEELQ
ncbi:MAG TPA: DUF542 domain-containing protein [Balneolaceae bacterium]|nr:DUF542 domain-containing protein [Balneolaceae bacterium]